MPSLFGHPTSESPERSEPEGSTGQLQPLIAASVGVVVIAMDAVAPVVGIQTGALGGLGIAVAGCIAMGFGIYGLHRLCTEKAQESQGLRTGLKKARAANQRAANWLRRLNESTDFYWETDALGLIRQLEGAGAREGGIFAGLEPGMALTSWPVGNMDKAAWNEVSRAMRDQEAIWNLELRVDAANDRPIWIALSGKPSYGAGRVFDGYSGVGRDITPQKVAEKMIQDNEITDRLTRTANRHMLLARLPVALAAGRRRGKPLALLLLKVVGLSKVNADHGLLIGDQLLQQIAQRLQSGVRETDRVARMEGDQFAVLLEDAGTDVQDAQGNAQAVAQKLDRALQQPYAMVGQGTDAIQCQVQIGIAVAHLGNDNTDSILKRARSDLNARDSTATDRQEPSR